MVISVKYTDKIGITEEMSPPLLKLTSCWLPVRVECATFQVQAPQVIKDRRRLHRWRRHDARSLVPRMRDPLQYDAVQNATATATRVQDVLLQPRSLLSVRCPPWPVRTGCRGPDDAHPPASRSIVVVLPTTTTTNQLINGKQRIEFHLFSL